MEDQIYCFDTRYNGEVLSSWSRSVKTNQRLQFDLDSAGNLLATGNHDGTVSILDISDSGDGGRVELQAHADTVNCVSFHPYWGMLATGSGRRHFHIEDEGTEENSLKIWAF